jgi:hypothetical protein
MVILSESVDCLFIVIIQFLTFFYLFLFKKIKKIMMKKMKKVMMKKWKKRMMKKEKQNEMNEE